MNRATLYVIWNFAFILVAVMAGVSTGSSAHPLYLAALMPICSVPILLVKRFNDRYCLLAAFFLMYFMWFGFEDFVRLLTGATGDAGQAVSSGVIDDAELAILLGGTVAQFAYLTVCGLRKSASTPAEWSRQLLVGMGPLIWAGSTLLSWNFKVNIMTGGSTEAVKLALESLGPVQTDVYMLATYLQPAGVLMMAYAFCRYRSPVTAVLMVLVVFGQFVLGFVDDGKGEALSGVAMLLICKILVEGRIPKAWMAGAVAAVLVAYPALQVNRALHHAREITNAQAAASLPMMLQAAFLGGGSGDQTQTDTGGGSQKRAQSPFERASLKDTVEVMFSKIGSTVAFRNGDTLEPLLTTFIPRAILPDKRIVAVGLMVQRYFFPQQSGDVNLSDSQLAEFYWNFGWPGVLIGMALVGTVLGFVGVTCDLSAGVSLTRVLVIGVTIQLIVFGFETGVATQYSEWLRMMVAIGVLHLIMARREAGHMPTPTEATHAVPPSSPRFSNILR